MAPLTKPWAPLHHLSLASSMPECVRTIPPTPIATPLVTTDMMIPTNLSTKQSTAARRTGREPVYQRRIFGESSNINNTTSPAWRAADSMRTLARAAVQFILPTLQPDENIYSRSWLSFPVDPHVQCCCDSNSGAASTVDHRFERNAKSWSCHWMYRFVTTVEMDLQSWFPKSQKVYLRRTNGLTERIDNHSILLI